MRLWSLAPEYLDVKGLTALWREGLLARKVLLGETKGYKNHPQLERFKASDSPILYIDAYLHEVVIEATRRGYRYDVTKLGDFALNLERIRVTSGQISHELAHLKRKLLQRDPLRYEKLALNQSVLPHPLFEVVPGEIESWEKNVGFDT